MRWQDANRQQLGEMLPDALVVLPIGATEQHGPHLATGTDALVAATLCERAAAVAEPRAQRPIVLAPPLPFGASDHHLPFGGTLSLTAETLLAVLLDLIRSVAVAGGKRLVIVNGHGGNVGICHAAAAAAATRHDLAVAHLDYWRHAAGIAAGVPGHAGVFETSLVLAIQPDLVSDPPVRRQAPNLTGVAGVEQHRADVWREIDGYTDRPDQANAAQGEQWLEQLVTTLAERLVELARVM